MSTFSRKSRTIRKKKDPNAPKRPRSAYILFCAETRPHLKDQNPEAKPSHLMQMLGEAWKKVTDSERKRFNEKADMDRDRYKKEMAHYTPPPDMYQAVGRRGKKKRDPNAPKRAMSGYLFFGQEMRPKIKVEFPEAKSPEIMTKIGERWREMSDEQKAPYLKLAEKDKQRYALQKAAYESKLAAQADMARSSSEDDLSDDESVSESE